MYEIETVRAYNEGDLATALLHQMLDSPAETFVVGSQDFIASLPEPADSNVIVHKDVTASGPNVVVCGDARCWVETPGGALVFRSGFFADEVRASFGQETPTQQPPTPAPPPVESAPTPADPDVEPAAFTPGLAPVGEGSVDMGTAPEVPADPTSEPAAPEPDSGLVFVPSTPPDESGAPPGA